MKINKIKLIKEDEEEKEKIGWAQRMRGIGEAPKYEIPKPLDVGLEAKAGLGAGISAIGKGITLPEVKPLEPKDKSFWDIGKDPKLMEYHKINFESWKLWFKELKESKDKLAFIKGEGYSPELTELHIKRDKLAPYMYEKSEKRLQDVAFTAYGTGLAYQLIPLIAGAAPEVINKILYKTGIKDVNKEKLLEALRAVSRNVETPEQRKIFDAFIKAKEAGVPFAERMKGIKIPTIEPRFAFAGKLYTGLPADEIVKAIVEIGKVTPEMVKGLDPAKTAQITQQLLNTAPALANVFLEAVGKPIIPEVGKITPKIIEEIPKAIPKILEPLAEEAKQYKTEKEFVKAIYDNELKTIPKAPVPYNQMSNVIELTKSAGFESIEDFYKQVAKVKPKPPIIPAIPEEPIIKKVTEIKEEIPRVKPKEPTKIELPEKQIVPITIEEAREVLKQDPIKPSQPKEVLAEQMLEKKVSIADIEAVKGIKIDVKKPKDIFIALRDIKAVEKKVVEEPTPKVEPLPPDIKKEYLKIMEK